MSPGEQAIDLIKSFEGLRLRAYRDAVGVWTIGYGHTKGVHAGMVITQDQALLMLLEDIADVVTTIHEFVPRRIITSWPQACFDALVSFVFNVGRQAFINRNGSSTQFLKSLLGPDIIEVARQMQRWVKGRVDGKLVVLPGLVRRRGAEAALWGAGVASLATVKPTEQLLDEAAVVAPEPPQQKLLEHPGTVASAGAGAAGVATAATVLTQAGQGLTFGGDRVALILGLVLILIGAGLLIWISREN